MDKLKALLKKLGAEEKDIAELEAEIEADKEAEVAGLKKKNAELIAKAKTARGEEGGKVAELEDKIDELSEKLAKTTREAERAVKKAADDAKAAQDIAAAKSQSLAKLIRDEGLTRELVAVGVKNPAHLKAAAAMLRDLVQVDEEKGEAFILDKDGKSRKALADFAKDWAAGDEGKHFVAAATSSGGGAQGGGGGAGGGKTMAADAYNALRPAEQAKFINGGGRVEY